MKLVVRAVGKMRDRRLEDVCREYIDRVKRHLPVEIGEVESDSGLLRGLPPGTEIIALEPGGDAWDTPAFTNHLNRQMNAGTKAIAFLIGGADGLSAEVVGKAQRRLSLSPLTLPHRLARVV
ncbi:MAG TPA: 23S rRNA (pseudouridine(1915)-N(3))-methyltransferase RlmH, partial [Polyangia bacterium]